MSDMIELMDYQIIIDKELYDSMVDDCMWLTCLEAAGVDNWEGVEYANEFYDKHTLDS